MEKETFPVRHCNHCGEARKNVKIVSIKLLQTELRNLKRFIFVRFYQNYDDQHFKYVPDIFRTLFLLLKIDW